MSAMGAGAEERLRRLEDLEEIRGLMMEYRRALDEKDFRRYSELFARTGQFDANGQVATGPQEILELVEGMVGTLLTAERFDDFHVVANPIIDLDGDRARASSTWVYFLRGDGDADAPRLAKIGRYDDELVREDGRWRFVRRNAPTDAPRL